MNDKEIKKIGAGFNHNFVLQNDGTLLAWGDNSSGISFFFFQKIQTNKKK